ncbi:uncharacterized protein LOC106779714 [Vigna radiata var. radiata]|uniref:Uncharacterized protein LOC106779714 n=1 Tax=Vigna radiata var. radiata TaxID=3916 RepID=A0A1S3VYF2_VIGRR|nr:uncharacterized protein LOC106779714 [Vigna radiata var. radiata]
MAMVPLHGKEERISNMFKNGKLKMDWYLSVNDREKAEVRAAFHMDDGGIRQETKGEPSTIPDTYEDSSDDGHWEAYAEEIIRKKNSEIIILNGRIASLTKELMDLRQCPIYNEEGDVCHDEEGYGVGDEGFGGGDDEQHKGDEGCDGGDDEHQKGDEPYCGGVEEHRLQDERCGGGSDEHPSADEEPPLKHHKVAGTDKAVASDSLQYYIDVDDGDNDVDVDEEHVPLRKFVGDPATDVDVEKLYIAVSVKDRANRVVCDIIGGVICVNNVYALSKTVDRCCEEGAFQFFDHIINDYNRMEKNQHVYTLHNFASYLRNDHFGLADIPTVEFVFMPFFHDYHWWCYCLNMNTLQISVIDSLNKAVRDRKRIDLFVGKNMAKFLCMLYNQPEGTIAPLPVVLSNIPSQPNLFDCGVIMLKAMEIWDGEDRYNGKSLPQYTNEDLREIRKNYVKEWILDNENLARMEALHVYGFLEDC